MELQHVNAKIYTEGELPVDPERFIEVFHDWIREDALSELLIDVADYRHVPDGPGVLLIALEADYAMDHTDGRWGMRYNRKAALEGSNADRISQALGSAARASRMLESRLGSAGLKFGRQALELYFNDRLLAPNTPESYAACRPEIEAALRQLLGNGLSLEAHLDDPRRRFGFTVACATPIDLDALAAS